MQIDVKFTINVPPGVTEADAQKWLRFNLQGGGLALTNPLDDKMLSELVAPGSVTFNGRRSVFSSDD